MIIQLPAISVDLQAREKRDIKDYFITQSKTIFLLLMWVDELFDVLILYISLVLTIYYLLLVKLFYVIFQTFRAMNHVHLVTNINKKAIIRSTINLSY
jgi:hypothetical protein